MQNKLQEIVGQLKRCKYTCQAGPLENNTAFIELEKLAQSEDAQTEEAIPSDK